MIRLLLVVVGYTLRACLPPRRRAGVLVLCAVSVLFGLVAQVPGGDRSDAFARVAANGLFGLSIPLTALVIGDAVLGAEIRSGTFAYTWLSPVPLGVVATGRWLGGTLLAWATIVPSFAVAAVVGGSPDAAGPLAVAAAAGTAAYVALFVTVAVAFKRSAVVSLLIVFLVERLLGTALSGIAQLSPTWEARAVFTGLVDVPADLLRGGIPTGWSAVGRLSSITVVLLVIATMLLRRLRLTGAGD